MNKKTSFQTRAIHHGYDAKQFHGSLNPPIYMTSTFAFDNVKQGAMAFEGENNHYIYSRLGTPSQALLENRIANLESAEAALATASGMGAITSTLWSLVQPGDEIIAEKTLYGCTFSFFEHGLQKFGVKITYCDLSDTENLANIINEKTKVVFCESPANPNMRMIDIRALANITKESTAKLIVDNTYCTPYLQRPIEMGADLVVHSATKYLGGHGDLIAFKVKGDRKAGEDFVNQLTMILCAVSLGDTESLIQHPASMTHSTYTEEELKEHLICPNLLRLSVGLEDIDDIIEDLEQALCAINTPSLRRAS